jgi:hypothetical protein
MVRRPLRLIRLRPRIRYASAILHALSDFPGHAGLLAQTGSQSLPRSHALAIRYAEAAEDRRDWAVAAERYASIRERFAGLFRYRNADGKRDRSGASIQ